MIPGDTADEILFTSHVCHPSLANDNLSGIVVAIELARTLAGLARRRFSYRFVFAPGTIGSITWLSRNGALLDRIRHGLVLTGLGGPGPLVYKRTRRGTDDRPRGDARGAAPAGRGPGLLAVRLRQRQFNAIGSTCRSAGSRAPRTASTPSTTRPRTTSASSRTRSCSMRTTRCCASSRSWRTTPPTSTSAAHGEPQLGKRGSTRRPAAGRPRTPSWRCSGPSRTATAVPRCWTSRTGPASTSAGVQRCERPGRAGLLERASDHPGR